MSEKRKLKINHVAAPLRGCARCGEDHERIEFEELDRPIELQHDPDITHWAMCPTTEQPIVMRLSEARQS